MSLDMVERVRYTLGMATAPHARNAARDRFLAHAAAVRNSIAASDTYVLDTAYNVEIGENAGRRLVAQDPTRFILCKRSAS